MNPTDIIDYLSVPNKYFKIGTDTSRNQVVGIFNNVEIMLSTIVSKYRHDTKLHIYIQYYDINTIQDEKKRTSRTSDTSALTKTMLFMELYQNTQLFTTLSLLN